LEKGDNFLHNLALIRIFFITRGLYTAKTSQHRIKRDA
jgi:hypothetical protein